MVDCIARVQDGSKTVEWILSSELPERSNFTFERVRSVGPAVSYCVAALPSRPLSPAPPPRVHRRQRMLFSTHTTRTSLRAVICCCSTTPTWPRTARALGDHARSSMSLTSRQASHASYGASCLTSRVTHPLRTRRRRTRDRSTSCRRETGACGPRKRARRAITRRAGPLVARSLVMFPCDSVWWSFMDDGPCTAMIYEVDNHGVEVARVHVPWCARTSRNPHQQWLWRRSPSDSPRDQV